MILTLKTGSKTEMKDITAEVRREIKAAGMRNGLCVVYVPHTTAAVTINESADPSVRRDILMVLNQMVPWQGDYRHMEGNSAAHVKCSLIGASETLLVESGEPVLGTWQGIFFCEFDGPRTRKVHVRLIPGEFSGSGA